MKKAKELRDLSIDELQANYQDTKKELFRLVNDARISKKTEKPHLIQGKKKEIARILTVMHEKQLAS